MNDTPSYAGLLNAVAQGERRAADYLNSWAAVTPNPDVRSVIHSVALREAEHGLAFEKRLDELGLGLLDRPDSEQQLKMAIASSTTLTDREKFEQLKLGRTAKKDAPDVFDRFFENKDIDPQTGGLLGRYIAEERDTGRRFAACYDALCAASAKAPKASANVPKSTKKAAKKSTKKAAKQRA